MLGFVEEPYPAAQQAELLHSFRTRGYMVLPDVFADADSVAAFRRRVVEKAVGTAGGSVGAEPSVYPLPPDSPEMVEPICAPRIRSMLPGALSAGISVVAPEREADHEQPFAALVERPGATGSGREVDRYHRPLVQVCDATSWLIDNRTEPQGWHRDRWVEGEERSRGSLDPDSGSSLSVNSAVAGSYSPPEVVHLAMYYQDMTRMEQAPTEIIGCSHRDPVRLDPRRKGNAAAERHATAFLIRAVDCAVSCREIAEVWVAFFSRYQRYRC